MDGRFYLGTGIFCYWCVNSNRETGLHIMWTQACLVQVNVAYNNMKRVKSLLFLITNAIISNKWCSCLRYLTEPQLKLLSQSFNLIIVVQRDPNATEQYTSNNKDAFKYRDHRGQLPACFSHSAVISWGEDNSLCSVLCVMWWRVSPTWALRCPQTTGCYLGSSQGNYSTHGRRMWFVHKL